MGSRIFSVAAVWLSAIIVGNASTTAVAVIVASDNSGDAAYNSGWSTGTNGGTGFNSWTLRNTSSSAGHFQASATNNDAGGPATSANINVGGDSFAMFANSNARAAAYRSFDLTNDETSLLVGYTFSWAMDNGGVDESGASVGLSLRSGNANGDANDSTIFSGRRFSFEFLQGVSGGYQIFDGSGLHTTNIGWRRTGLRMEFTLTSANTYSLDVFDVNSGSFLDNFTGTLAGAANSAIESFAIYDRFAGGGGDRDLFFNSFIVSVVPESSAFAFLAVATVVVAAVASSCQLRRVFR